MKNKRVEKKLVFSKETISDLSQNKMDEIKGGITNGCITLNINVHCTFTVGETSHALSVAPYETCLEECAP